MSGAPSEDLKVSFFIECEDLLEAMQDGFDALVERAEDPETLNEVFRAVHSIKGGAGAFSLVHVVDFAHCFETALDHIRSGKLIPDSEVFELLRQCGDHLSDLIGMAQSGTGKAHENSDVLLALLKDVIGPISDENQATLSDFVPLTLDIDAPRSIDHEITEFKVSFAAHAALFSSGNEPAILFAALAERAPISVFAALDGVPVLTELDPNNCYVNWEIDVSSSQAEAIVSEVFEFVEAVCDLQIVASSLAEPGAAPCEAVSSLNPDEMPNLTELIGSENVEQDAASPKKQNGPASSDADVTASSGTIRVDLDRIDKLINLVGELVIKEAILSQSVESISTAKGNDVSVALDSLKQLAGEIQEGVMAIRAQPVKPMFRRMARIVRESSKATGKPVRFMTIGETVEVDKTVIERLIDPLTHMVRNAIDHGLETPQERQEKGKPAEGTLTLSAAHRSGRVLIDVVDDGAGIDRPRVLALAIERGLVAPDVDLSPEDIDQLLFAPGFSSKSEVSALSGRGVGLDVVRSEIQRLGGRVSIQSEPGEGTTFSISLPLTLAVLDGMVVRVEEQTLIVPISAIQETLQLGQAKLHQMGANDLVMRGREGLVPVLDLGASLGFRKVSDNSDDRVLLLIASDSGRQFALAVDAIQDQRQVVIKSLEQNYGRIPGIAAATILGDGRIALIVDPDCLAQGGRPVSVPDTLSRLAV